MEVARRVVPLYVQPEMPRSLKLVRALLPIMAALLTVNTIVRLGVVRQYGLSPGISSTVGSALLAIVGFSFLLACVGAYFALGVPNKRHWWLSMGLPVLAVANIMSAIAVIPEEHVGVALVLDVYLFNGLLPLALVILLLKRPVRTYFGITHPASHATAA
jgi:hypothetical protein